MNSVPGVPSSLRVAVEFQLEIENNDKPWLTGIKVGRFFFE